MIWGRILAARGKPGEKKTCPLNELEMNRQFLFYRIGPLIETTARICRTALLKYNAPDAPLYRFTFLAIDARRGAARRYCGVGPCDTRTRSFGRIHF